MLRRIEGDERNSALLGALVTGHSEAIVASIPEAELETPLLPHDHPKWVKDALTVSQRAREAIVKLRPVIVTVLSFWDHRVRALIIGGTRISVDASGSYRREF